MACLKCCFPTNWHPQREAERLARLAAEQEAERKRKEEAARQDAARRAAAREAARAAKAAAEKVRLLLSMYSYILSLNARRQHV